MSEFHLKATHCSVIDVVGQFSEAVWMNKHCDLTTMKNKNAFWIKYFLLCTWSSEAHTEAKSVNNVQSLICKPSSGAGLLRVLRYHHPVIAGYTNSNYDLRVDLKCVSIKISSSNSRICNHTSCSYLSWHIEIISNMLAILITIHQNSLWMTVTWRVFFFFFCLRCCGLLSVIET